MKIIKELAKKPGIWAVCSDVNEGKSMLLYNIIEEFRKEFKFNLFTYGLRVDLPNEQKIYSIEELEKLKNSLVVVDEFFTLFDLEDRRKRRAIENSLRLINHNNNILILSGVCENFKKMISSKIDVFFFKRCTISDFINGGRIKNICLSYKGPELGSSVLNLDIDKALVFDGKHYNMINIDYLSKFDTKKKNEKIFVSKKVHQKVENKKNKTPLNNENKDLNNNDVKEKELKND